MGTIADAPLRTVTSQQALPGWQVVLKRAAIWAIFLALMYLTRDFFFLIFMTFMFSYIALAAVGRIMKRFSPSRERHEIRSVVTLAVFLSALVAIIGVGALIMPRLLAQGQSLAGWMSQVSPETEVANLLAGYVGPSEFRRQYGGLQDDRYKKALEEFRETGDRHVAAYLEFPKLEAWLEGGFSKQFNEAESGRIRSRLMSEGTSSKDFEQWFRVDKFPELQIRADKELPAKGRPAVAVDPLVRAARESTPDQLLRQVRHEPARLATLRDEWLADSLAKGLTAAKETPTYQEQFRAFYNQRRESTPLSIPYTYEQYVELSKARTQGRKVFGDAVEKMDPSPHADRETRLRADFEAAKKHELFQEWWGGNSTARFIRHEVESSLSSGGSDRAERMLTSLLGVPGDICSALLLSFLICVDFPRLRLGILALRETWLKDGFDELAAPLSDLGKLMGRAMQAQAMIALCNAMLVFAALTVLNVEHAGLLALAVFVLCQVPTLGMMLAWVLLAGVALIVPGGGMTLALKVTGAVIVIVLLETFVFSPRILGRMMELHPVLIMAILPLAQFFFGIWGLLLATPVAVYVVHVLILRHGLPGMSAFAKHALTE